MRFVDLFAGLGGFHLALRRLGHRCVFASEIDAALADLYERNFGMKPEGDIRDVPAGVIPAHDILCAGFPCQPFSKAGEQQGFGCPKWGDLFDFVLRVLESHRPRYVLLENVPNILRHDGGKTWQAVESKLVDLGYRIKSRQLSPHRFGIPQIRERVFVVGSQRTLDWFQWPRETPEADLKITDVLDDNPPDARAISDQVRQCLDAWQEFLNRFPADRDLPSFPIWSMEFGATYPYEQTTPYAIGAAALGHFRGSHGKPLQPVPEADRMLRLPSHARTEETRFPHWKVAFIRQNRGLYAENKQWVDEWLPSILGFPSSLQKFEWNCKGEARDVWQLVVQFRASGVRVKRTTTAPSLVAMTSTQVPIIAWQARYMTPRECARLQSMDDLSELPDSLTKAYQALGNAVNVDLVEKLAAALLNASPAGARRGRQKPSPPQHRRPAGRQSPEARAARGRS